MKHLSAEDIDLLKYMCFNYRYSGKVLPSVCFSILNFQVDDLHANARPLLIYDDDMQGYRPATNLEADAIIQQIELIYFAEPRPKCVILARTAHEFLNAFFIDDQSRDFGSKRLAADSNKPHCYHLDLLEKPHSSRCNLRDAATAMLRVLMTHRPFINEHTSDQTLSFTGPKKLYNCKLVTAMSDSKGDSVPLDIKGVIVDVFAHASLCTHDPLILLAFARYLSYNIIDQPIHQKHALRCIHIALREDEICLPPSASTSDKKSRMIESGGIIGSWATFHRLAMEEYAQDLLRLLQKKKKLGSTVVNSYSALELWLKNNVFNSDIFIQFVQQAYSSIIVLRYGTKVLASLTSSADKNDAFCLSWEVRVRVSFIKTIASLTRIYGIDRDGTLLKHVLTAFDRQSVNWALSDDYIINTKEKVEFSNYKSNTWIIATIERYEALQRLYQIVAIGLEGNVSNFDEDMEIAEKALSELIQTLANYPIESSSAMSASQSSTFTDTISHMRVASWCRGNFEKYKDDEEFLYDMQNGLSGFAICAQLTELIRIQQSLNLKSTFRSMVIVARAAMMRLKDGDAAFPVTIDTFYLWIKDWLNACQSQPRYALEPAMYKCMLLFRYPDGVEPFGPSMARRANLKAGPVIGTGRPKEQPEWKQAWDDCKSLASAVKLNDNFTFRLREWIGQRNGICSIVSHYVLPKKVDGQEDEFNTKAEGEVRKFQAMRTQKHIWYFHNEKLEVQLNIIGQTGDRVGAGKTLASFLIGFTFEGPVAYIWHDRQMRKNATLAASSTKKQ